MSGAKTNENVQEEEEEEDKLEAAIRKTGCSDENYAVQDCMFEHRDWRKCQSQVQAFKECIMKNNKKKQ